MTLIWNTQAVQTLKTFLQSTIQKGSGPQFFLLVWPEGIGKSSYAQQVIQEMLGNFTYSDLLYLRDYSSEIGKQHAIPVEITASNQTIDLPDGTKQPNYWVRELNLRLQQSWFSPQKFVLIENIHRMSISAVNAFLKTAEEPLPGRFIIATTTHPSQLLDTILSRSIQISFSPLSEQEMLQLTTQSKEKTSKLDQTLTAFLLKMAMGKPGVFIRLTEKLQEMPDLQEEIKKLIPYPASLSKNEKNAISSTQVQKSLKKIAEIWLLDDFLDGWIAYATEQWYTDFAQQRLEVKRLSQANVNLENLLRYGITH